MISTSLEERVAELERRVANLEATSAVRSSGLPRIDPPKEPGMSPREWLNSSGATKLVDKALAVAYYVIEMGGAAYIDYDNFYAAWGAAKEPIPKNRRDPFYQNVAKGYLQETGDRIQSSRARNRWTLTKSGKTRVEARFA